MPYVPPGTKRTKYDLVGITWQALQVISIKYYKDLITHYKAKDLNNTISSGLKLLGLMSDVETLLASDKNLMAGGCQDTGNERCRETTL
ncbi:hypothetical protein LSAT2_006859 [Lamellibrachia satsuma]|nr:hypothetical protein LSAT2_006859 [Lamellibrachia satsuma]